MICGIKTTFLEQIAKQLESELAVLERAVKDASANATSEESKPENKYDTRALEASYLAGGQSMRVEEIRAKIQQLAFVNCREFKESEAIGATALVEIENADQERLLFFLFDIGAGTVLTWSGRQIRCISIQSPMGQALLGKTSGDVFSIGSDLVVKEYEIVGVM